MAAKKSRHKAWAFPGFLQSLDPERTVQLTHATVYKDRKGSYVGKDNPWYYRRTGSGTESRICGSRLIRLYEFATVFADPWVPVEHSPLLDSECLLFLMSGYISNISVRSLVVNEKLQQVDVLRASHGQAFTPKAEDRNCSTSNNLCVRLASFQMSGSQDKFVKLHEDMSVLKALMDTFKMDPDNLPEGVTGEEDEETCEDET